ncbi:hypothetical protein L9F63_021948 [Diploptera punctata]|uniref:Gustatory receptor n=1 Tax=Diploptera punctata TaxID=6984 RepID=A0AAD7ZPW1_DIPPU|nr:hypothetical protein L9F63_021948 [Diploptera punctata]
MENITSDKVASNVYVVFKPFLLTNKIFGITIRRHRDKSARLYSDYVLSVVWIIFLTSSLIIITYYSYLEVGPDKCSNKTSGTFSKPLNEKFEIPSNEENANVTDVSVEFEILDIMFTVVVYLLSAVSILMTSFVYRNTFVDLLETFSRVDALLYSNLYINYLLNKSNQHINIIQIFMLIPYIFVAFLLDVFDDCPVFCAKCLSVHITSKIAILIISFNILQFCNLVILLKNRLKILNTFLQNYYIPMDLERRTQINIFSQINSSQIDTIRAVFIYLYDIANMINSIFGLFILIFTSLSLINIITAIGWFIEKYDVLLKFLQTFYWCFYSVVTLVAISVSCEKAVRECVDSSILVQKILVNRDLEHDITFRLDKLFVQLNSMKIQFTACGMFNIDLQYLSWILGVNITYILFIFQSKSN